LGDPERFTKQYYASMQESAEHGRRDWPYFAGDGAMISADGYYDLGARDDVINVAGHRLAARN